MTPGLLGFAGAFRRSEIVGLQIGGVQSSDAGRIVSLRRSKTDQEGASFTKGIRNKWRDLPKMRLGGLATTGWHYQRADLPASGSLGPRRNSRTE